MSGDPWARAALATRAVRVGQHVDVSDAHSEPLALTSSYVFDDAEDAAEKFAARRAGNVYIRFTNPTVEAFEQRLAALEEAEAAVATASGMAGLNALAMALLEAGDHVVVADGVFGTTTHLFTVMLRRFGIEAAQVPPTDLAAWRAAVTPRTKMFVLESPTNPLMQVVDIPALAEVARAAGALLIVDNTLMTPVFQTPIALGADAVVHSAGKFIDGQGRAGGGVVAGSAALVEKVKGVLRTAGPTLSPFNAWIFLKGLETLPLRMREHSRNAALLASWLAKHDAVGAVHFTGLHEHPQAALIARQQTGHPGLVSFTLHEADRDASWRLIDGLRLISNTTNIGDSKTMITHPASTTHGRLSDAQRDRAGIAQNLVRVSVGFEDIDDLTADLEQAVDRALDPAAVRHGG